MATKLLRPYTVRPASQTDAGMTFAIRHYPGRGLALICRRCRALFYYSKGIAGRQPDERVMRQHNESCPERQQKETTK